MVDFTQKAQYTVEDLRRIVALLRAPGGCPWDGAQTHESIRRNFIEEAYEVAEAIDEQSPAHLKEELGDVLLQVVFHASLEEDAGRFDLDDVADGTTLETLKDAITLAEAVENAPTCPANGNASDFTKATDDIRTYADNLRNITNELDAAAKSVIASQELKLESAK